MSHPSVNARSKVSVDCRLTFLQQADPLIYDLELSLTGLEHPFDEKGLERGVEYEDLGERERASK